MKATPKIRRHPRSAPLSVFILVSIVLAAGIPVSAEGGPQGSLSGLVLDPTGEPAEGFRLVFRSDPGQVEYTSPPSDPMGKYAISLPAGGSYVLIAALAPDGTRLEVPQLPPIPVEQGVRRLDVRFRRSSPDRGAMGKTAMRDLPWWRIGGATLAVVVFSSAVYDGGDERAPSAFRPTD